MWIYFILLAIIALDFYLEKLFNKSNKGGTKLSQILNFVFQYRLITITAFVLISTLRAYSVGIDAVIYFDNFQQLKAKSFSSLFVNMQFEFGYTFLCFILAKIGCAFRFVLFLASLFISFCFYKFICKFSTNNFMSFILYVCLGLFAQSLNIIRQLIALGFVLLSITYLFDKKIIKSIVLTLCASMFHITAILTLIFILIKYLKPTKQLVAFMILSVFVGVTVFPYLMKLIEWLTPIDYYSLYFVEEKHKFIYSSGILENLYTVALWVIFIVLFALRKYLTNLNERESKLYDFFLLIYIFVPLIRLAGFMLHAQSLLNRLSVWFFFSLIILIPLFIHGLNLKKKWMNIATCGVYIIALGYMIYFYAIQASNGVVPYAFMF